MTLLIVIAACIAGGIAGVWLGGWLLWRHTLRRFKDVCERATNTVKVPAEEIVVEGGMAIIPLDLVIAAAHEQILHISVVEGEHVVRATKVARPAKAPIH